MSAGPATATPKRKGNWLPLMIVMGFLTAIFFLLAAGQNPWDVLFINPLINSLIFLDIVVLGQFGLAIILFTAILRIVTIPFTIRQLESTRAMQTAQPQMQEIQKKYKDPKRRQEEMMKLYKEHNINPLGCIMPLVIQMVVFIALFRALSFMVGGTPESLIALSDRLYAIPLLHEQIPLNQHFLWLNLGQPDNTLLLPLLVGISTYVQQKMSITPNASPQMMQQQQMMTWLLPIMLAFFTAQIASGVGLYWVASNIFSLFASYYVYGKRVLNWRQILLPTYVPPAEDKGKKETSKDGRRDEEAPVEAETETREPAAAAPARKARGTHGKRRGKRKDRRRGY
jgi:YidC/Oxa1 family membrane protein insertase